MHGKGKNSGKSIALLAAKLRKTDAHVIDMSALDDTTIIFIFALIVKTPAVIPAGVVSRLRC